MPIPAGFLDGIAQNFDGGSTSGDNGSPTQTAGDISLIPSTGGLQGISGVMLVPTMNTITGNIFCELCDPTNFDTEENVNYQFRQEEIVDGQFPTISKVRLRYRDLGKVTVKVTIFGSDAEPTSQVITFGGKADNKIRTVYADLVATIEAPQLLIERFKDAGPLAITKASLIGTFGDGRQL